MYSSWINSHHILYQKLWQAVLCIENFAKIADMTLTQTIKWKNMWCGLYKGQISV
jgi:hypothetical protein